MKILLPAAPRPMMSEKRVPRSGVVGSGDLCYAGMGCEKAIRPIRDRGRPARAVLNTGCQVVKCDKCVCVFGGKGSEAGEGGGVHHAAKQQDHRQG